MPKIEVHCDRGGPAGRHSWRWGIVNPEDNKGDQFWDRRCTRCLRWFIDVIEHASA